MTGTQLAPPPESVREESPQRPKKRVHAIHDHPRARVFEPGPSAPGAGSQDPTLEPKWGLTMMLGDLAYLLRLTRRKPGIDF